MASDKNVTMKLINSVETCVDENLLGLVYTHPGLRLHPGYRVVTLSRESPDKVAILTGGGSGHEPFTAGFIGDGALSGAVAGGIFASPPTSNILYGISHLCERYSGGVLVIIPNYTGDRLNFGKAIEKAKIAGLKVEGLILGEDVASSANKTGGRGMCGLVVLYKMCGAMAADGMDLCYIFDMAKKISKRMATLSVCLKACSLPGQPPLFEIAHGELDLGAGVHGEAGIERRKLGTARETIELVLSKILSHLSLAARDRVAVMINNLGSTSVLEVNILAKEIKQFLDSKTIRLERIYSGHLMTSLEMHGVQICVLHLNSEHGDNWLKLLDAKTNAPAWPGGELSSGEIGEYVKDEMDILKQYSDKKDSTGPSISLEYQKILKSSLQEAADVLIENEQILNRLDSGCGDGDCGVTMKKFSEAVINYITSSSLQFPGKVIWELSEIAEDDMGGTSGGIYSLGLAAAAQSLAGEKTIDVLAWQRSLESALQAISKYGGAEPGDRTMLDTLHPALKALKSGLKSGDVKKALTETIVAAEEGAKSTITMRAKAGRAAYVSSEHLREADAGAHAAALWTRAILSKVIRELYA